VSRNLAVAPLLAATLDAVKIEARHGADESEWHSAHLMTADPVAGLCVLRADFGRDVKIVDLPDKKSVPSKRAELRLMTADPSGDCDVDHGALAKILEEDEPDEKLQVDLDNDVEEGDPIGRAVFDSKGLLVGLEVGRLSKSKSLCVSAYEIRAKKKEAAKLPADHRLDRIDLPEPPVAGSGQTPPGQTPPGQTPDDGAPEKPTDQGKDDSKNGKKKTGGSSDVKTADAVRGLARAAKGVVDDAVPLPELTAKERKELGDRHREQVLKEHRPVRDEKVQTRIRKIVDGLLKADGRKTKDFTVNVVQDSVNNAYAFVGGNIIVNEGFLAFAGTDDEMIHYVLGHEIGHVVKGHVDMPFRRQKMAGGLPGGSMAADAVSAVLANSAYSQGQEEDADCFSVELLRKMRISTAGGVRFFNRLNQQGGGKGPDDGKDEDAKEEPPADDESADDGGRAVGALFGSHPDHDRRIELLTNGCGT
jgi:Zn-dependent protease with chaperone function